MRVSNYSVAMNAQYFNLQFASQETKISTVQKDLTNTSSSEISTENVGIKKTDEASNQLAQILSKAILKSMHAQSRETIGDKVIISNTNVEAQALNYSISAFVQADGKEIELSLNLNLSRSFVQKTVLSVESLQNQSMVDPLVINLNGAMPSLSSKTFSFDIDSDGKSDQISQLNAGNGFLALDKDSNGKIDNGSELFGTKSGDGFSDLSQYDEDNNGWIDENDAIFDKLRIWQKSEGKDTLIALGEVGIGAIFLGNITTPFTLKTNENETLGELKKSGFVLFENGKAGIISHVDLALKKNTKETVDTMNSIIKNLLNLKLDSFYRPQESKEDSLEKKMQEIQKKIRALEAKLAKSHDTEKPNLQVRIGMLYAQLMTMIQSI